MKDDQLTFRLPRELARALARRARERRVPKSQLVREVLEAYLAGAPAPDAAEAWRRVAPMVGALALDQTAIERDEIAAQIRAHNWRE
ncbi:MAG: ribbon-helix-helix protein, CopG family [Gemmatimonadaceae bacterium]